MADFLFLDVENTSIRPQADALAVIAHLAFESHDGSRLFPRLAARWRESPEVWQVGDPKRISDRIVISAGRTAQLDVAFKYPDEDLAYALNTEATASRDWRNKALSIPAGSCRLVAEVAMANGGIARKTFEIENRGAGQALVIRSLPRGRSPEGNAVERASTVFRLAADVAPLTHDDLKSEGVVLRQRLADLRVTTQSVHDLVRDIRAWQERCVEAVRARDAGGLADFQSAVGPLQGLFGDWLPTPGWQERLDAALADWLRGLGRPETLDARHHEVAAVGSHLTCSCGRTFATGPAFKAHVEAET
jgi:hypothetical protein